jgi:phosphatidate cytidylyltransferase
MLKQRVITAIVLLAALIGALWAGQTAFAAAMSVLIGAGVFEWWRLAQHTTSTALVAAMAFAVALFAVEVTHLATTTVVVPMAVAALLIWIGIAVTLVRAERAAVRIPRWVSSALCFVLLGAAAVSAMDLMRQSTVLLVSALAIVWIADTAAYFAGRRWGKTKLAPKISPGKTWAGVAGAVIAVLLIASAIALLVPRWLMFSTLLLQRLPLALGLIFLGAIVLLSIVGDLFESLLKRQVGAKDSGKSLPGHGGVLDRIDALLPVLPATALLALKLIA